MSREQSSIILEELRKTYQPQRPAGGNLHSDENLVVRHIQNDLILWDEDVTAAVSVGTEGGVGMTWCIRKTKENKIFVCYFFIFMCLQSTQSHQTGQNSDCSLTLPDSSAVNVDLHRIRKVMRLVVVQDEDVAPQGVDTGWVHCCILGKMMMEKRWKRDVETKIQMLMLNFKCQKYP